VRLSVGLEDAADLIADLAQALGIKTVSKAKSPQNCFTSAL